MMQKLRIAVLCGGPSSEYEVSLRSAKSIVAGLKQNHHVVRRIILPKCRADIPHILRKLAGLYDIAFIAMHGKFGEDGTIQRMLENIGVPYTCSGVVASEIGMNKMRTFALVAKYRVRTPRYFSVRPGIHTAALHRMITRRFGYPCVIRPNGSGSSIGISIVRDQKGLPRALKMAFSEDIVVLCDEYVAGTELTCGVLGNAGQTKLLALPSVKIVPPPGRFFDYEAKYSSEAAEVEICPAGLPKHMEETVRRLSKKVHALLKCSGITRSDFIVDKNGKVYFLEINTIPGLTDTSLCPKEAKALGWSFAELLQNIIGLALLRHKQK